MSMDIIIIPLMTGFLAWLIAWLFVQLIFWPKHAGIKKLFHELDISMLINKENSAQQFEAILPTIDNQLNDFFTHKLAEKMPMVSMFIGDKTIVQLKTVFVEEMREIFPMLIQQMAAKTKDDFALHITSKWKPILVSSLLKATRQYRNLAFAIGLAWGVLMVMLTHHV
jgi:hypothetical protein